MKRILNFALKGLVLGIKIMPGLRSKKRLVIVIPVKDLKVFNGYALDAVDALSSFNPNLFFLLYRDPDMWNPRVLEDVSGLAMRHIQISEFISVVNSRGTDMYRLWRSFSMETNLCLGGSYEDWVNGRLEFKILQPFASRI